jgi:hypothetical protein
MASRAQAFRDWASSESLTTSGSIDQLKNKRLIIDAEDFLETILTSQASREPLLPALGGLPFALRKHVDTHIANFKEANITPTFVFNGLDLACKDRTTIARDSRLAARSLDEAWSLYSQSRADEAVAEFGKSCTCICKARMRLTDVANNMQALIASTTFSDGCSLISLARTYVYRLLRTRLQLKLCLSISRTSVMLLSALCRVYSLAPTAW